MPDSIFTTKEILLQLADTVDDRFDDIERQLEKLEGRITDEVKDHESRLRKVERIAWSRWTRPVALGSAFVSTVAAIAVTVLNTFQHA